MGNREAELFVRLWQDSTSLTEVATRLGIALGTVRSRAAYYRRIGVPLKKMPARRGPSIDVAKLVQICRGKEQ